jgi:hypothetical protein
MTLSHASLLVALVIPAALAQQPPAATPAESKSPFLSVPTGPETLRFGAQLPEFEVKDISGRTWRSEDLRGKFTLVYIWHTFAARADDSHGPRPFLRLVDLPELQRFHDKVRNHKSIQVLAFCKDYEYTHAPEYLKQTKYTFPVIADWVLLNKLIPETAGKPPYWVISPEGRLSYPLRAWSFGGLLYELERAASRN